MAGIQNDVVFGQNVDFSGINPPSGQININGELLVGANSAPFIRPYVPTGSNGIIVNTGAGTLDFDLGIVSVAHGGTGNSSVSGAQSALQIGPYSTSTYLPIAKGSGGDPTVTYTNQSGIWTRVGNLVYFSIYISWNGGGYSGGGGNAQFSLPFTSVTTADSSHLQIVQGCNGVGQFSPYFLSIASNSNVGTVANGGGFVSVVTQAGIGGNSFSGCYIAQ